MEFSASAASECKLRPTRGAAGPPWATSSAPSRLPCAALLAARRCSPNFSRRSARSRRTPLWTRPRPSRAQCTRRKYSPRGARETMIRDAWCPAASIPGGAGPRGCMKCVRANAMCCVLCVRVLAYIHGLASYALAFMRIQTSTRKQLKNKATSVHVFVVLLLLSGERVFSQSGFFW